MSDRIEVDGLSIGLVMASKSDKAPVAVSVRINGQDEFVMEPAVALALINVIAKGLNAVQEKMLQQMQQQSSIILPGVSRARNS